MGMMVLVVIALLFTVSLGFSGVSTASFPRRTGGFSTGELFRLPRGRPFSSPFFGGSPRAVSILQPPVIWNPRGSKSRANMIAIPTSHGIIGGRLLGVRPLGAIGGGNGFIIILGDDDDITTFISDVVAIVFGDDFAVVIVCGGGGGITVIPGENHGRTSRNRFNGGFGSVRFANGFTCGPTVEEGSSFGGMPIVGGLSMRPGLAKGRLQGGGY